jgi:hypothetical protein
MAFAIGIAGLALWWPTVQQAAIEVSHQNNEYHICQLLI